MAGARIEYRAGRNCRRRESVREHAAGESDVSRHINAVTRRMCARDAADANRPVAVGPRADGMRRVKTLGTSTA